MKVVIDEHIPYIREAAERLFDEVVYLRGADISRNDIRDADALIVRTRTRCNRQLLNGTRVGFIATATIGYDHLDTSYLAEAGIGWANCPGCNAGSVAQYVRNVLLLLAPGATVGLIGVGHVGKAVAGALRQAGFRVLLNDPPREQSEGIRLNTLRELQDECEVISIHTPLTHAGPFATHYLIDRVFLCGCKHKPVIINTARGGVVCEADLLTALSSEQVSAAVVDTWEGEPHINPELLERAAIATPHIAGYSADGKANASRMALEAVCCHFGITSEFTISPPPLPVHIKPTGNKLQDALLLYDPRRDSERLKAAPEQFEQLRNSYPLRREMF